MFYFVSKNVHEREPAPKRWKYMKYTGLYNLVTSLLACFRKHRLQTDSQMFYSMFSYSLKTTFKYFENKNNSRFLGTKNSIFCTNLNRKHANKCLTTMLNKSFLNTNKFTRNSSLLVSSFESDTMFGKSRSLHCDKWFKNYIE